MAKEYPKAKWNGWELEFFPLPFRPPIPSIYVLIFVWKENKALLSYIPGRGWCIPSGKVKTGEDSKQAAFREVYEETGAKIAELQIMGSYKLTKNEVVQWADVYAAKVAKLDAIPKESEARCRNFYSMDEIPRVYFAWSSLFEILFRESLEKVKN